MHSTVKISDVNVTKDILKTSKTDLNAIDPGGKTILHHAAYDGHLDKVKYLVEEGANFEIKDKSGKSPLDLATDKQNNEVVGFL
ncbi:ankyrin repeat domain-containing protein [Wolbachia pipientis]|uniref:ankyrin repeat domain-containing protein n=1 Tax=Wolbachia pipientis TaxID=955 RepID=UPI0025A4A4D3|nr:ankyrin repeat domain-containing protein [Wolbachia pipientis]MDM8335627.1 ankyrin repeat domain-containing protein [Wolbachia pipientis]